MKKTARRQVIWLFTSIKNLPVWGKFTKLEWTLMIIGAITTFFIFINVFTSWSDNTQPSIVDKAVSLQNPAQFEAALAMSVNSTVEKGSPITILTNGQEFLPDLLSEIKNAKQSIYITDFIWDNGTFGHTLFLALIEKAKEGVQVRVLLDGLSGRKANKDDINQLTAVGGKVGRFRQLKWWNVNRIDRRTHVRDFVIDDKISYVGGIAISDNWLSITPASSWHDYMFKSSGAMAERASKIFGNMWSQTTGENLSPTAPDTLITPAIKKAAPSEFVSLFSSPAPDLSSNMDHFIWLSIMAAHNSIHIENPYLVPNKDILGALTAKARQGLDVELIIPGKYTDSIYTRLASQSFYKKLLDAGVKIYEYQPSRIHAKVMTMDNVWSIVGSANLDNRSSEINLETIMGIHDTQLANDIEANFAHDKQSSVEVTKDQWSHRSILLFPLQQIARLFIHQY